MERPSCSGSKGVGRPLLSLTLGTLRCTFLDCRAAGIDCKALHQVRRRLLLRLVRTFMAPCPHHAEQSAPACAGELDGPKPTCPPTEGRRGAAPASGLDGLLALATTVAGGQPLSASGARRRLDFFTLVGLGGTQVSKSSVCMIRSRGEWPPRVPTPYPIPLPPPAAREPHPTRQGKPRRLAASQLFGVRETWPQPTVQKVVYGAMWSD